MANKADRGNNQKHSPSTPTSLRGSSPSHLPQLRHPDPVTLPSRGQAGMEDITAESTRSIGVAAQDVKGWNEGTGGKSQLMVEVISNMSHIGIEN